MGILKLSKPAKSSPIYSKQISFQYGSVVYPIKQGGCLWGNNQGKLEAATTTLSHTRCIGIAFDDCESGKLIYVTFGKVTSSSYLFMSPEGSDIWVGRNGYPTDQKPTSGYKQKIGISINKDTFLLAL